MPKYKFSGSVLFCDDMRHELGGKTSLIGVYSDTINVAELPMEHPHFHTVGSILFEEYPEGLKSIQMIIRTPDEQEISMDLEIPKDNPSFRVLRPVMIGRNLTMDQAGDFKVLVKVGDETRVIGSIPLVVGE